MIVVSNTTPLITLMKAMKLDILKDMFKEILIPETVFDELVSNESYKEEADEIREAEYIHVVTVKNASSVSYFQRVTGLDRGESEQLWEASA